MTPTLIEGLDQQAQSAQQDARTVAREAADAANLVEALREKVRSGADVSAAEIAAARDVAEHAELRAEAARRQAEQAKQLAHRAKLEALAAEIADHADDSEEFVAALVAVEEALEAFAQLADVRGGAVTGFRRQMHELGIPEHPGHAVPGYGKAEHAGLCWEGGVGLRGVGVNGRMVRPVDVGPYIAAAVHRLSVRHGGLSTGGGSALHNVVPNFNGINGPMDLHAQLRKEA